jgi:hypothetical protein
MRFALLLVFVTCSPASASFITLVANRSDIKNPETVDWGQLGPAGTVVPQPFTVSTDAGYTFTVLKNNSPTPYVRVDQGSGFVGDFLPGERLLYPGDSQTAFDFRFDEPIQAIGAQLQRDQFGPWTPYVRVFTSDGDDIRFTLPVDVNTHAADGSAPFVGVRSDSKTITRVLFDSFFGGRTGINHVTLSAQETAAVPGPGGFALCVAGFVTGLAARRFGRKRTV